MSKKLINHKVIPNHIDKIDQKLKFKENQI